ncbi:YfhE family protein [Terribacillus sp. AE2B 122]|jgi:hypothetical protein|nr:hypothetical protein [Terribacillus sp. AE2B 122]
MAKQYGNYQPVRMNGVSLSDAREVTFGKEFKRADIAGGFRQKKGK